MKRHFETRLHIDASAAHVWSVLTDTSAYPAWTRDLRFHAAPQIGANVRLSVRLFGRKITVPVHFEQVCEQRELRWRGGPEKIFQGTHYIVLRPLTEHRTLVVHGELFEGVFVPGAWPVLRRALARLYDGFNSALQERCEATR